MSALRFNRCKAGVAPPPESPRRTFRQLPKSYTGIHHSSPLLSQVPSSGNRAYSVSLPPQSQKVRYSIPKNFFTHHIKWKKGCLHFSTQIRSNCPVRTPWMISGDSSVSRVIRETYAMSLPMARAVRSNRRGKVQAAFSDFMG